MIDDITSQTSISDELAKELDDILEHNSKPVTRDLFVEFENTVPDHDFTELVPGLFNAVVDSGFGQSETKVDLKKILTMRPRSVTPIGEDLYMDTLEIKGWYGRLSSGFSHTREFGQCGDINLSFSSVQFKMVLFSGGNCCGKTVNIAFNIYKNGKMRFSGGLLGASFANHPELIRKFVLETYTDGDDFFYKPFKYNNLGGQFLNNGLFRDFLSIARHGKRYGVKRSSYEPEINSFLYVYFDTVSFKLTKTGKVQILGAKSPSDLLHAYEVGKTFMRDLNHDGQIYVTGKYTQSKSRGDSDSERSSREPIRLGKCSRMRKAELQTFARQLGVVDFRVNGKVARKDQIWDKIFEKVGGGGGG
jgi:TATA-box binding protein (TBP) (component of TFIID and TFIIIB)